MDVLIFLLMHLIQELQIGKILTFNKLKIKSLIENVNIHMNSSAWVSILIANLMKKKQKDLLFF